MSNDTSVYIENHPNATVAAVQRVAAEAIAKSGLVPDGYAVWEVSDINGDIVEGYDLAVDLLKLREPALTELPRVVRDALEAELGVSCQIEAEIPELVG